MMAARTASSSLDVSRPRPFSNRLSLDVEMPVASEISTWDIPAFSRSTFNELAPTAVRKPSFAIYLLIIEARGIAGYPPLVTMACFFCLFALPLHLQVIIHRKGQRR